MEQKILYELSPSQEVSKLQCAYSIFKRVINILTSASTSQQLDFDLMTKALNVCVQRHDCTRIRFVKKGRKLMQYFVDSYEYKDIPLINSAQRQNKKSL